MGGGFLERISFFSIHSMRSQRAVQDTIVAHSLKTTPLNLLQAWGAANGVPVLEDAGWGVTLEALQKALKARQATAAVAAANGGL